MGSFWEKNTLNFKFIYSFFFFYDGKLYNDKGSLKLLIRLHIMEK